MADTDVRIIFSGDASKAIPEIEKVLKGMKSLNEPPETLTKITKAAGDETANILGMNRREWMRTGNEAVFYMTAIAGKSGEMGQSIASAAGMVTQLGESFAFGGTVGVALAAAGLGISLLVAQNPKVQELNKELEKLAKHDDAVSMLAELAGVEESQAKKAIDAAKESQSYANTLKQLALEAEKPLGMMGALGDATGSLIKFFQDGIVAGQQLIAILVGTAAAGASLVASFKDGISTEEANARAMEAMKTAMIGSTEQLQAREAASKRLKAAVLDAGIVEDRLTRAGGESAEIYKIQTEEAKKYSEAVKQVANAQNTMLKGMVEKSLTPTSVTDADMQAAKLGTYQNKWDEFRRRIEAVTKGTDPSQFGSEFAVALSKLNMPLDVAAQKFKDFSLFADPRNLKLVDWSAMTADIGSQLMQLVGKANLMKEGFAKAWAGLSADQRKSLRELGIDSAGDAKKALMGTADSGVDGFVGQMGDKETTKKLKGAGDTLVKNVQSGMLDKETMKTWTGGMDALVTKMQEQFNVKENIKILNDAGMMLVQSLADGISKSTALSEALMGAVDKAIQEALAYIQQTYGEGSAGGTGAAMPAAVPIPTAPGFASGGVGVFARGGYVRVDTGEGYAFTGRGGGAPNLGGSQVVVNYAPQVSLASQAEVASVLEPLVRSALKNVAGRRN